MSSVTFAYSGRMNRFACQIGDTDLSFEFLYARQWELGDLLESLMRHTENLNGTTDSIFKETSRMKSLWNIPIAMCLFDG